MGVNRVNIDVKLSKEKKLRLNMMKREASYIFFQME
jgi:hypothetical protein